MRKPDHGRHRNLRARPKDRALTMTKIISNILLPNAATPIGNGRQSFSEWRNSLPNEQRWMADAMAYSATQGTDVQGYQYSGWSWDKANAFYGEQNASEW